jgi:hypothetical protein
MKGKSDRRNVVVMAEDQELSEQQDVLSCSMTLNLALAVTSLSGASCHERQVTSGSGIVQM